MSCIRFNTPEQREQLRQVAMLTSEQAAARHPVPVMTESKLRRLRLLAADSDPKIRESVASNRSTPADVLRELAVDVDIAVRGCVARNESTPPTVLRALTSDSSDVVRSWLAINQAVPDDTISTLANDPSASVRGLVEWRLSVE